MRSFLHFFVVLFGVGYISSAARTCVRGVCHARLISMLAISGAGTLVSVALVIALLLNVNIIATYEWVVDILLVAAWAAVTGLTMFVAETLATPLAPPLIAFTWCALTLVLITLAIATFGCDGPACCNHNGGMAIDHTLYNHMAGLASAAAEHAGGPAHSHSDGTTEETERDATPELAYIPHTESASAQASENV